MGENWYLLDSQGQRGPFEYSELIARLRKYVDLNHVLVWREGFSDWLPASQLFGPNPEYRKISIGKWALWGLVAGLVICACDLLFEWRGKKFSAWDGNGLAHNIGYVVGTAGILAIVGFIIGALARLLMSPKKVRAQDGTHLTTFDLGKSEKGREHKYNNFVARNWRGELPLWVSYWVIGFATNVTAVLVPLVLVEAIKPKQGFGPLSSFAFFVLLWATLAAASVWQLVGIWRSANVRIEARAEEGKKAPWAGIAKFMVIVGFIQLAGIFAKSAIPQLNEAYRIAFLDDPDIPDYSIRLLANGKEIEVSGGIKFCLSDDLRKILKASRQVKIVHLDSIGGRLGEGAALNSLIKEYGLNTYVSSKCMSACTLAFAGGSQRVLKQGAILGFHRGAFGGEDQQDDRAGGIERRIFREAGFESSFISRALSTPNKDMWKPSSEVLVSAGVVTRVSSGLEFAMSGYGSEQSRESIDEALQKASGVYVALKERFPKLYGDLVEDFFGGLSKGENRGDLTQRLRSKLGGYVKSLLPFADDFVVIDFGRLAADQYEAVGQKNAQACYNFASGEVAVSHLSYLSDELRQRELSLEEKIIRSATKRPPASDTTLTWKKLADRLTSRGFSADDLKMIDVKNLDPAKHAKYCWLVVKLYREIVDLPRNESASVLREIFATK